MPKYGSDHEGVTGWKSKTRAPTKRGPKTVRPKGGRRPSKKQISLQMDTPIGSGTFEYRSRRAPVANGVQIRGRAQRTASSVQGLEMATGSSVLLDINSESLSGSVNVFQIDLNPGLAAVFPQAAPIASLFSEYRVIRARARWVPGTGTQVSQRVGLCADSNVLATAPTSFTSLVGFESSVQGQVWQDDLITGLRNLEWKFTRPGPVPDNADPKTYDAGWITVLVDAGGDSIAASVGMLVVDYQFQFKNRHLVAPPGCEMLPATDQVTGTAIKVAAVFNSVFLQQSSNPIAQAVVDVATSQTLIGLPAGYWLLTFNVIGDNTAVTTCINGWNGLGFSPTSNNDNVVQTPTKSVTIGSSLGSWNNFLVSATGQFISGSLSYMFFASGSAASTVGPGGGTGWFTTNFDTTHTVGSTVAYGSAMICRCSQAQYESVFAGFVLPPAPLRPWPHAIRRLGRPRPPPAASLPRERWHEPSFSKEDEL